MQLATKTAIEQFIGDDVSLTRAEAMKFLKCGKSKLATLMASGEISFSKGEGSNSRVLINLKSLIEYKAKHTQGIAQYR